MVDFKNHRHLLGTVGRSELKDLQIPSRLVWGTRTVQLKVYPILPRPGLGETTSGLLQLEWEDPLLQNLDQTRANRTHLLIWAGTRFRISDSFDLDVGFSEDIIRNIATDITFHLGVRVRL